MPRLENFEIIAGTYEEYLLGYVFSSETKSLVQSFASHDHSSSIRCLAACGKYLASGASDDRIIIYDLKNRKEHCMLTHHDSTVTALTFTNNHTHVISASQDGSLAIVRVGNWQLEKNWEQAHKKGNVLDIAVHSSGKLALTLGSNATIHTWNLIKGRVAFIINLNNKCKDPRNLEKIVFAPDDNRFLIFGGKYTEVWSIEAGGVLQAIEHDQRVTCSTWLDNDTLFVGYEDGSLGIINLTNEEKKIIQGHSGRVKSVQYHKGFIVTASSTGQIKVWTRKLKEVATVETGCRITCLCIAELSGEIKKEESEEEMVDEQAVYKKPVKSTVVVEVEDDSEEEANEVSISKKRKRSETGNKKTKVKKTKKKADDLVDLQQETLTKKKKSKSKKKKVKVPT